MEVTTRSSFLPIIREGSAGALDYAPDGLERQGVDGRSGEWGGNGRDEWTVKAVRVSTVPASPPRRCPPCSWLLTAALRRSPSWIQAVLATDSPASVGRPD